MEIRARKAGRRVCSPDPKYQGRERTHPPQPSGDRQTGAGPKPGAVQLPEARDGESACSAEAGCWVLLVFSRDCFQALRMP